MPSTRITVALNTNHSQRSPLLIPANLSHNPTTKESCAALVKKTAQAKLRLKKPTRIFLDNDGRELLTHDDWDAILRSDVTLLVSAGEEYVGKSKDTNSEEEAKSAAAAAALNPNCTIVILADKAPVEPLAITQVETTAHTLPGLIHACAQPDLHPGTKFPIGAVFVSKEWIHPPLIGGDIGCGMAWYKTTLSRHTVDGDKAKKVAERLRGLEGSWRTQHAREAWLSAIESPDLESLNPSAGEEFDKALGTIGAGNHFAEIQVIETADGSPAGLQENDVVLLVHSGSRGYGTDILKRYTAVDKTSLHETDEQAKAYMAEHARACAWATANRDLIALRFLAILEPGEHSWVLGSNSNSNSNDVDDSSSGTSIAAARHALQARKVVDIWHNNVSRAPWPPTDPSNPPPTTSPPSTYAYIHRKGAAPTHSPRTHTPLPLLPLPGSRSTPTLLLTPLFPTSTLHGHQNALSLAHGAGRALSRRQAFIKMTGRYGSNPSGLLVPRPWKEEFPEKRGDGRDVKGGTWVVCEDRQLVFEEAREAYKDVYGVAGDLEGRGVARVVGWARPRVCYKVRDEGR